MRGGYGRVVLFGDEFLRGVLLLIVFLRLCFSRGNEGVNFFFVFCLLWDFFEF